jgi:two-component system, sensor histidine kinase PdtaS
MKPDTFNEGVDDSLLLAVIHSSNVPLILLDGNLNVVAASDSFGRAFGLAAVSVEGRKLVAMGAGEWNVPQLENLLSATASGLPEIEAYEMDLKQGAHAPRRLVVNARKLAHSEPAKVRLLLTIMDVTDARIAEKLKDDLLREKGILLQELQHRVANSLQIIASVLMQSARRTQSEETKANLNDAHLRIMSVAQLQQQLAASRLGEVNLRSYFTDLCRSIGASMIRDDGQISLTVSVDDSVSNGDVSISLGLIVTELVINALKHAFPGGRIGTIKVGYGSDGEDWVLSVVDNGIGLPAREEDFKPGLGTNIVEAIANSLDATITTTDAKPGLSVSIAHH